MFAQTTATKDRPRNSQRGRAAVAPPVESRPVARIGRETAIDVRSLGANGSSDPCRIPQKVMAALNEAGRKVDQAMQSNVSGMLGGLGGMM